MKFLDNSSIVVDAILTKKGRELLARGFGEFNITQWALADDEVDYDLWNPTHPQGSDYYGIQIENMPLLEATPDETQSMKYKLVTLKKKTSRIPIITVGSTSITLTAEGDVARIVPNTSNFANGNKMLGYTAILSDSDLCDIYTVDPVTLNTEATIPRFVSDSEAAHSVSVIGYSFEVRAKKQILADKVGTVTIIGNETGGRVLITVTALQETTATIRT
jgi:hypothetical protein